MPPCIEALRVILVPDGVGDGVGCSDGVPGCEVGMPAPKPTVNGLNSELLFDLRGDGRWLLLPMLRFLFRVVR